MIKSSIICYVKSNIQCSGAALNIEILNKEVNRMLNLHAYIEELSAKKNEILNKDDSVEINTRVEEYRAQLVKEYEEAKAVQIAKIDSDIDCVNTLIARENEVKEGE